VRVIIEASDDRLYMTATSRPSPGDRPDAVDRPAEHRAAYESGDDDVYPLRFITRIEVQQGDRLIGSLDGGMTLSENPRIAFDHGVNGAGRLRVRTEDMRHAVWEQSFTIGSSS